MRLRWCGYWRRYEDVVPSLVIFVGRDGTAYAAADYLKLLRQKRLGKAPPLKRKVGRPKRPPIFRKKPTHDAHRSVQ